MLDKSPYQYIIKPKANVWGSEYFHYEAGEGGAWLRVWMGIGFPISSISAINLNSLQRAAACWELLGAEAAAGRVPEGAAPNPSAADTLQPSNKGAPAIVISNGPLCKPLIAASLNSDLNALLRSYRCTL